jgi:hypothetical protein
MDITVDSLVFSFPDDWEVVKFDDWAFYRNQLMKARTGLKAIDLLAIEPGGSEQDLVLWLIEVKDYRIHKRSKDVGIAEEMVAKTLDTLSGILPAALNASESEEQDYAQKCLKTKELRVVLHLETAAKGRAFDERLEHNTVQDTLRKKIKAVDAHPKVVSMKNFPSQLPWRVSSC